MEVRTLWGKRPEDYEGQYAPELMVAWDEYCLEANSDGYEAEKAKAIKEWGGDLVASRELILHVPDDAIKKLFAMPAVNVEVEQAADTD